jgi:hypothetical protein
MVDKDSGFRIQGSGFRVQNSELLHMYELGKQCGDTGKGKQEDTKT